MTAHIESKKEDIAKTVIMPGDPMRAKFIAENPDYGLVGNPSTVEDSISVASINNKIITTEVFEVKGLEGNADVDNGKFDYSKSATDTDFEKILIFANNKRHADLIFTKIQLETNKNRFSLFIIK